MKNFLITGSNGLLGHKLAAALLRSRKVELTLTSLGSNKNPADTRYTFDRLDIVDPSHVNFILDKYKPEVVINTAAMTNVDQCETDKDQCWNINVEGVKNLAVVCKKSKTHLIHLSTDFIFDGSAGPYKEDDAPNPLSQYARSKVESEKVLLAEGLSWSVVRTMLVYGIVKNPSRSNFVLWAKNALEKGEPIKVVTDQYRDPTLAEDLAEGCIQAALKKKTGVYHISGKDGGTIFELVDKVAEVFGLDKSVIKAVTSGEIGAPANRPARTGFILDKAVHDLSYKPHSFKEGLEIVKRQLAEQLLQ